MTTQDFDVENGFARAGAHDFRFGFSHGEKSTQVSLRDAAAESTTIPKVRQESMIAVGDEEVYYYSGPSRCPVGFKEVAPSVCKHEMDTIAPPCPPGWTMIHGVCWRDQHLMKGETKKTIEEDPYFKSKAPPTTT